MKNNKNIPVVSSTRAISMLLLVSSFALPVFATEGGASKYPMGADGYLTGMLPPPGMYGLFYGEHYEADNLRGNDGEKLPVDFRARLDAAVVRLVWVTDTTVLGGALAGQIIAPLADVKVRVNHISQSKQGLGDVTLGAGLGYHYNENLHIAYGLDISAPTGSYDRNDIANLGRNYWMFEPIVAVTYIQPHGLNANAKFMYDFNSKNPDTNYKSGQEFHVDYAVGWAVSDALVLGVGGYIYRQTTDDNQNGETIQDNKGRVFAVGPSVKYSTPKGWTLTAKWQEETGVRNRAQGNAYWVSLALPL